MDCCHLFICIKVLTTSEVRKRRDIYLDNSGRNSHVASPTYVFNKYLPFKSELPLSSSY